MPSHEPPEGTPIPKFEYVFSITLRLDYRLTSPIMLSGRSHGSTTVTGGEISGPRLSGIVVPFSGADASQVRPDGVLALDARYLLETDDGVRLFLHNQGIRDGSAQVARGIDPGVVIDTEVFDLRTSPVFDAPPGKYDWLTRSTFAGIGRKLPDGQGNTIHYFRIDV